MRAIAIELNRYICDALILKDKGTHTVLLEYEAMAETKRVHLDPVCVFYLLLKSIKTRSKQTYVLCAQSARCVVVLLTLSEHRLTRAQPIAIDLDPICNAETWLEFSDSFHGLRLKSEPKQSNDNFMEMTLSMKAVRLVFTIYLNLVLSTCISLQAPHILQVLRWVWIYVSSPPFLSALLRWEGY